MTHDPAALETEIDSAWEDRATLSPDTRGPVRKAVKAAVGLLDRGEARVAEKVDGVWTTHQWLKKAVLLSFRLTDNGLMGGAEAPGPWWDKVPAKWEGWGEAEWRAAGFRAVPGSYARRGAFIGRSVVLMPSFVNIGAYVGEGTMVDTWASVGSCAQVGRDCHISAGAGIGGVLEPLQANPTVIEDGCFIGARSEIVEGAVVEQGCVISMGVFITASTKIVDRATGAIHRGRVPAYSVVAPGVLPGAAGGVGLACAVIVKTVDAQTRSKTSVNELLRD